MRAQRQRQRYMDIEHKHTNAFRTLMKLITLIQHSQVTFIRWSRQARNIDNNNKTQNNNNNNNNTTSNYITPNVGRVGVNFFPSYEARAS